MAKNNPVYGKQLYVDDGTLKGLEDDLNVIDKQLKDIDGTVKDLRKTTEGMTAVNKKQRESIQDNSIKADKLAQENKKLKESYTNTAIEIRKIQDVRKKQNKVTALEIKLARSAEGSYDKLSAQYSLNKIRLNAMSKEQREATKAGKAFETQTREIYEEMSRLQKQTGKSQLEVGKYKEGMGEALQEQEVFGVSANKLGMIFSSTAGLIGAGVAIIGGLAKAYTSSARGARDLARASDRLGSIMNQLGNGLADASGEAGFMDNILRGLQQQFLGMGSVILSNMEVLTLEALRDIEVLEFEQEKQKKAQLNRAEQLRQIRDEERNSFEDRKNANNELGEVITKREEETVAFQQKRMEQYKILLALDEGNLELQKAIAQIEFEIADAREEAQGFRSEMMANDLALYREYNEQELLIAQKRMETELIGLKDFSLKKFEIQKALIDMTREMQVRNAGENAQLRELALIEAFNNEKKLIDAQEKYFADQRAKSDLLMISDKVKIGEQVLAQYESNFDEELDLWFQNEETKTDIELKEAIARMDAMQRLEEKQSSSLLGIYLNRRLRKKALEEQMDADEIARMEEQNQKIEEVSSTAFDSAVASLQEMYQIKVDLAEESLHNAEREVDASRAVMDAEIRARELGLANNVASAQKEFEVAKKLQDEANKEKKKAVKEQQTLDSITQASSLITASANIWSSMSSIPVVGSILALAAIALMWGSFAYSKTKANQVTSLGEGGTFDIEGGSHRSGNDVSLGVHGGNEIRVEGKEKAGIFNRKVSKKHGRTIDKLVRDINKGALDTQLGNSVIGSDQLPPHLLINAGYDTADLKPLEGDVRKIRRQGEKQFFTNSKGQQVMKYKNLRRTYV